MNIIYQPLVIAAASAMLLFSSGNNFSAEKTIDCPAVKKENRAEQPKADPVPELVLQQYQDIEIPCMPAPGTHETLVINSRRGLKKWEMSLERRFNSSCNIPEIDFDRYTLVVAATQSGGCQPPVVTKKIAVDESTKSIDYSVKVEQQGLCKKAHIVPLYVIIPKVEGYELKMDIDKSIIKH